MGHRRSVLRQSSGEDEGFDPTDIAFNGLACGALDWSIRDVWAVDCQSLLQRYGKWLAVLINVY